MYEGGSLDKRLSSRSHAIMATTVLKRVIFCVFHALEMLVVGRINVMGHYRIGRISCVYPLYI